MIYSKYYTVSFHGRVRLATVSKDEAVNYASALFAKNDERGEPPVVDEFDR